MRVGPVGKIGGDRALARIPRRHSEAQKVLHHTERNPPLGRLLARAREDSQAGRSNIAEDSRNQCGLADPWLAFDPDNPTLTSKDIIDRPPEQSRFDIPADKLRHWRPGLRRDGQGTSR